VNFSNFTRNFSHINNVSTTSLLTLRKYDICRYQSTEAIAESPGLTPTLNSEFINIPEPPAVPVIEPVITEKLAAGLEPTFESLGLAFGNDTIWPYKYVEAIMEYLHVDVGCEWWTTILIGTITVRTLIFPLVLMSQRNAAKLNNVLPQMQVLQMKLTEARQTGNSLEAARYSNELMQFMKEKQVNPLKNMIVPLAQFPFFVSFFVALRHMANTPVESMSAGGLFWFSDLTIPDPYMILPIITSLTMLATIEVGVDGPRLAASGMGNARYVLRAMPFIFFPFMMNFPAAVLTYWTFSNFISLAQVSTLKIPAVREFLKIPKLVTHKPHELPIKPKGFKQGLQDSWTNMKITREIEERKRIDDIMFQKAAKGAIPKTYKFDPTKARPLSSIQAQPKKS
jgi:YidC/Oxa1 family membrane protein insertase